jgi:hypothetical protein
LVESWAPRVWWPLPSLVDQPQGVAPPDQPPAVVSRSIAIAVQQWPTGWGIPPRARELAAMPRVDAPPVCYSFSLALIVRSWQPPHFITQGTPADYLTPPDYVTPRLMVTVGAIRSTSFRARRAARTNF